MVVGRGLYISALIEWALTNLKCPDTGEWMTFHNVMYTYMAILFDFQYVEFVEFIFYGFSSFFDFQL